MPEAVKLGYSLSVLQQARHCSPLSVHDGLALSYYWVARAAATVACDIPGSAPADDLRIGAGPRFGQLDFLLARACLDRLQQEVDGLAGICASRLSASYCDLAGRMVWYTGEQAGTCLGLDLPHTALIAADDLLLRAQSGRSAFIVVVSNGAVMALISTAVAPAGDTASAGVWASMPPRLALSLARGRGQPRAAATGRTGVGDDYCAGRTYQPQEGNPSQHTREKPPGVLPTNHS